MNEPRIFVVARDYHTAKLYAQLHNIKKDDFRCVSDEDTLRGRIDIEIHLVTTCLDHPRFCQIMEIVEYLKENRRATVKDVVW